MNKTQWLIQTLYGGIVLGLMSLIFWRFKIVFINLERALKASNKQFNEKMDNIEKGMSELKQTIIEKYVRTLEKSISDNEKAIMVNDNRIKNLEREVFKNKDRRRA